MISITRKKYCGNDYFNQQKSILENRMFVYDNDISFINFLWSEMKEYNLAADFKTNLKNINLEAYDFFLINVDSKHSDKILYYLKQERQSHSYKVILTTNNANSFNQLRFLEMGFYTFLTKPISFEHLKLILRGMIEERNSNSIKAYTDELTKLPNRAYFNEILETKDLSCCHIAMLDLDDFKQINDKHGHASGDLVLKRFASQLQKSFKNDIVVRWGGEEFAIIFTSNISKQESIESLENFKTLFTNQTIQLEETEIYQTFSAGLVLIGNRTSIEFMDDADKLLYIAKGKGKNIIITEQTKLQLVVNNS